MTVDITTLAASIETRLLAGDVVTRTSGDEGSVDFSTPLDDARAIEILQRVQKATKRGRAVVPKFSGLQTFSESRGVCNSPTSGSGGCACRWH